MSSPPPARPSAALAHPVYWLALLLLVLNDQALKGSAAWPELITGKLSDLSGLIVAPLVLIALTQAHSKAARFACLFAIALPYAAINVSDVAASAFTQLTAALGRPWNIVSDAGDLWALAVLPVPLWILARVEAAPRLHARRALQRAGLVLGGLASAASSNDWSTQSFVVNRTGAPIDVRVRFAAAQLDCAGLAGHSERALSRASFGPGSTFRINTDETLPLQRLPRARTAVGDQRQDGPTTPGQCDALLLQADGLPDTIVFWKDLAVVRVPRVLAPDDDEVAKEGMLELHADGPTLIPVAGSGLVSHPLVDRVGPSSCAPAFVERFQWSAMPAPGVNTLRDVVVGVDGCLGLDFDAAEGRAYLCIPPEEFPFAPGDPIVVGLVDGLSALELTRVAEGEPRLSLTVLPDRSQINAEGLSAQVVSVDNCEGERTSCGSYLVPAAIKLANGNQVAGASSIELRGRYGAFTRVVVGRAEQIVVGALACEAGRDQATIQADLLIIKRGE